MSTNAPATPSTIVARNASGKWGWLDGTHRAMNDRSRVAAMSWKQIRQRDVHYTQVPTPLSNTPTKLPGRQLRRQLKLSHHTALALLLICAPGAGTAQVVTERDAARAKIAQSLSDRNFDQALAVYDAFVSIGKEPDVELLLPIARAELERETQSSNPTIAAGALERLARAGDADTLASLKRAANTGGATSRAALAPVISMARLGRQGGTGASRRLARSGTS